jgi:hypothetical protein
LQTSALITNNEATNRYIGGASANIKLVTNDQHSLKLVMNGGVDAFNFATTAIFPRDLQFEKDGNGTNGASIQGSTNVFNDNEAAFLVYSFYPEGSNMNFTTTAGLTRESFKRNTILVTATQLIGSQTNVDQAGAVETDQFISNQLDLGGFAQEEFNYNDIVIASLGFRADKSSNNGDVNKLYFYPKASLAVNIGEMDFWTMESWNTLKFRIAYGQSSNFPPSVSKYTSLDNTIIDGNAGSLINAQAGNSQIGPERQSEIETGFDLGFLNDRIMVDFTYYIKNVTDLLLIAQTPLSSGYSSQWINGADLKNHGIELGLGIELVRKNDFSWFNQTNFWFNRSEITRLDIPAYNTGAFGATLGTYRIEEGQSATQIVGIGPSDLDTDGDGLVVWGDYEPDFQVTFNEDLKWKNWQFSLLLHWKKGGQNVNLSSLLTDIFGTSYDYDATDLDPDALLSNGDYRLSQLGSSAQPWVENAGYVRIREIGLCYTIDNLSESTNGFIRNIQLGLSAHNPFSWFDYHSYDPEVSNFGSNGISAGVEVTPFPASKSYYFTATLNF